MQKYPYIFLDRVEQCLQVSHPQLSVCTRLLLQSQMLLKPNLFRPPLLVTVTVIILTGLEFKLL